MTSGGGIEFMSCICKLHSEIEEQEDQLSQEKVTGYESMIQEGEEKIGNLHKQKQTVEESL